MRPYEAKTTDEVCRLQTDHNDVDDYWILTDGYTVTVCEQKSGKIPAQEINVPHAIFNRLIAWYIREQKETGDAKDKKRGARKPLKSFIPK